MRYSSYLTFPCISQGMDYALEFGMTAQLQEVTSPADLNEKEGIVKGRSTPHSLLPSERYYNIEVDSETVLLQRCSFSVSDRVVKLTAPGKKGER